MRRLSSPTVRIKASGDQEVRVLGSIVLYMHTNKKADRDITGVPVLGRTQATQAKLMNYISYPEIHAPQQQQSSVSQDSIKSTDPKFDRRFDRLKFIQTVWTTQSMDSLNPNSTGNLTQNSTGQNSTRLHRKSTES